MDVQGKPDNEADGERIGRVLEKGLLPKLLEGLEKLLFGVGLGFEA